MPAVNERVQKIFLCKTRTNKQLQDFQKLLTRRLCCKTSHTRERKHFVHLRFKYFLSLPYRNTALWLTGWYLVIDIWDRLSEWPLFQLAAFCAECGVKCALILKPNTNKIWAETQNLDQVSSFSVQLKCPGLRSQMDHVSSLAIKITRVYRAESRLGVVCLDQSKWRVAHWGLGYCTLILYKCTGSVIKG